MTVPAAGAVWYPELFWDHRGKNFLADQNLNGRLYLIVDELVRRGVTLEQARREFEKQFIVASLKSNRGNFCRSAKSLGVHRNTLRNKVSDLGIVSEEYDLPSRRPPRRKPSPTEP
jgi:DNA-binding NtrC family response regulator